ncbi:response regulator [Solimonas marina]|uniref:Response regulator n=1 Tax=Solimonas marina TaxID=2714601 RepID=A0A970B752_9GAMM|nr:response regulator [Solimonas marina]NKF23513.1 response regulator [Solimonas marina]
MSDSSNGHILIVEDEPRLSSVLRDYLLAAGYSCEQIDDGARAVPAFEARPASLVLLDLMLPNRSGIEICRELRERSDVPIIMVTARIEEVDRLLGLEVGADDYICKPFSPREVVARVRAVLRRHQHLPQSPSGPGLTINDQALRASVDGLDLNLTHVEFRLLRTLAARPGHVYSRDQLMDHAYADHRVVTDRTVDSHIKNLRRKLADVGGEDWIRSVYGVGYRFER